MHLRSGLEIDIGIGMQSKSSVNVPLLLDFCCEGRAQKKAEEEVCGSVGDGSAGKQGTWGCGGVMRGGPGCPGWL